MVPLPDPEPMRSRATPAVESAAARKASDRRMGAPDLSPRPMATPAVLEVTASRLRSARVPPDAKAKLSVVTARLLLLPATEPEEVKLMAGARRVALPANVTLPANSMGEAEENTPERVISVMTVLPPVPALSVSR